MIPGLIQLAGGIAIVGVNAILFKNEWKKQNKELIVINSKNDGLKVDRQGGRLSFKKTELPCTIIIGPAGRGKTSCYFVPNILDEKFDGSMIIADYKDNELYRATAMIKELQGYITIKYEPDNRLSKIQINPFDIYKEISLEKLSNLLISSADLAYKEVYMKEFKTNEEVWNQMAGPLIEAIVNHVAIMPPPNNNFKYVAELMKMYPEDRDRILRTSPSKKCRDLYSTMMNNITDKSGTVVTDKMYSTILNTITTKLKEFLSDDLIRATYRTTFHPSLLLEEVSLDTIIAMNLISNEKADLLRERLIKREAKKNKHKNKKYSDSELKTKIIFYLCIPRDMLYKYAGFNLLFINMMYDYLKYMKNKSNKCMRKKIRIIIDEFTNIGKIEGLVTTIKLCRSANISWILGCQDINSLENNYQNSTQSLVENATLIAINGASDTVLEKYFKSSSPRTKEGKYEYEIFSKIPAKKAVVNSSYFNEFQVVDMPKSIDPINDGYTFEGVHIDAVNLDKTESIGEEFTDGIATLLKSKENKIDFSKEILGVVERCRSDYEDVLEDKDFTIKMKDKKISSLIKEVDQVKQLQKGEQAAKATVVSQKQELEQKLTKDINEYKKAAETYKIELEEKLKMITELQNTVLEYQGKYISSTKLLDILASVTTDEAVKYLINNRSEALKEVKNNKGGSWQVEGNSEKNSKENNSKKNTSRASQRGNRAGKNTGKNNK